MESIDGGGGVGVGGGGRSLDVFFILSSLSFLCYILVQAIPVVSSTLSFEARGLLLGNHR